MKTLLIVILLIIAAASADYTLDNLTKHDWGFEGSLQRVEGPQIYDTPIEQLHLQVIFVDESVVRVKLTDASLPRYEVPFIYVGPEPEKDDLHIDFTVNYDIEYTTSPFTLKITRKVDGEVVFDTSIGALVFEDHYLEFSTPTAPDPYVYGLGEYVRSNLRLNTSTSYKMWAIDRDGAIPDTNLYGSHPFAIELRKSGAHGMFVLNSNAQQFTLNEGNICYQTTGGVLDVFVMIGPSPLEVMEQYSKVIGGSFMPPVWALGWWNSQWGVDTVDDLRAIYENYEKNNLPLDMIVSDLDYMVWMRDFTFDEARYPVAKMKALVDEMHTKNTGWMPIFDPGIHVQPGKGYFPYDEGIEDGIFVRYPETSSKKDEPIHEWCWPGQVYPPDFFHTNISQYWTRQMKRMHDQVPFDACWTDMNEFDSFCNAQCGPEDDHDHDILKEKAKYGIDPHNPPFNPFDNPLDMRSINVLARHVTTPSATGSGDLLEYDVHNLYGYMEANHTYEALRNIRGGKRPFVLSRSTFAGSGKVAAHWTGDNAATWDDLRWSIVGILEFNLFNIPMTSADICGFNLNTTRELCARWIQVGVLSPFSRSHNTIGARPQEPYAFDDEFTEWSREWIMRKYELLPMLYNSMFKAHMVGEPVWRALFFDFASDSNVWDISTQFMLGPALLVSPVIDEGARTIDAYFPAGRWFEYIPAFGNSTENMTHVPQINSNGHVVKLNAPLNYIPMYQREGTIFPIQPQITDDAISLSVMESIQLPYGLNVAIDGKTGESSGSFFLDDGETIDSIEKKEYLEIAYKVVNSKLQSAVIVNGYFGPIPTLNQVSLFGIDIDIEGEGEWVVDVNGGEWPSSQVQYDKDRNVLIVTGLNLQMNKEFLIEWRLAK